MTSYYRREFSGSIDGMTNAESAWLRGFVSKLAAIYDAAGEHLGFNAVFETDDHNSSCWFYAPDQSNADNVAVDNVAQVVQRFLRRWRPSGVWSMTWADAGGRHRYGGGAVCVTADTINYMHTSTWTSRQEAILDRPISMDIIRDGGRISGIVPLELNELSGDRAAVLDLLSTKLTGLPMLTAIEFRPVGTTILPGGHDAILIQVSGDAYLYRDA